MDGVCNLQFADTAPPMIENLLSGYSRFCMSVRKGSNEVMADAGGKSVGHFALEVVVLSTRSVRVDNESWRVS